MTRDVPALSPRTRRIKYAFIGTAILAVGLALALSVASLKFLVQNAQNGQDTRRLLIECVVPPQERQPPVKVTDPVADCYTRAQIQQGKAINQIGDVTIRAACAAQFVGDLDGITKCVEDVTSYIKEQR